MNPKARYMRNTSEPYLSMYSSGETVLPLDLDIFCPSAPSITPWWTRDRKGSSKSRQPMSLSALVKNRAYNRCMAACSAPPTYLSTGSILLISSRLKGSLSFLLSGYLKKYQDEHTKVSRVSESLFAGPPQSGHVVLMNSSHLASGDSPSGVKTTL